MTRREMMSLAAAGVSLRGRLGAAELPGFYYRDYSRCLPDYLSSLARSAYEKRNRAIAEACTTCGYWRSTSARTGRLRRSGN